MTNVGVFMVVIGVVVFEVMNHQIFLENPQNKLLVNPVKIYRPVKHLHSRNSSDLWTHR